MIDLTNINFPKPILKWVGGKTQILDKVMSIYPTQMNNYHEIFLGGGSVLLALLELVRNKKINITGTINAYDLNENLIYLYRNIQKHPKRLYKRLVALITKFDTIPDESDERNLKPSNEIEARKNKESYYYWVRQQYNNMKERNSCDCSAMFIFLNKTCFRGVYRIGPNGFNVPYGNYNNPNIIEKEHLMEISKLVENVQFHHMDFAIALQNVVANDFVYMDPPYAPENEKSFVGYNADGFNLEQHLKLFDMCNTMKDNNIRLVMSNADVILVRDKMSRFNITSIECKRSINSKNPGAKTNEVIISY
jgi:DNA adenine methylase